MLKPIRVNAGPFAASPGWQRAPAGVISPPGSSPGGSVEDVPSADTALEIQINYTNTVLSELLEEMRGVRQELIDQTQKGIVYSITATVNSATPSEFTFDPKLFSISLICDGPGTAQYRIPNRGEGIWTDIRPGEQETFNFIKGSVSSLGLRILGGATAVIRILGTY